MNEKIGVIIDFLTPAYEKTLRDTAARCGYDIVFFPSSKAAEGNVDDCTILYGHPSQRVIAGARNLKWYASCWAGGQATSVGLSIEPKYIFSHRNGSW